MKDKTITFNGFEMFELRQALNLAKGTIEREGCVDCAHCIPCECCVVDEDLRAIDTILNKLVS